MEGLLRSLIHSSRIAVKNPTDYEARSNIMWTATWALNTLVAKGKATDWMVHMIGQSIGAFTDATHGMTCPPSPFLITGISCPMGLRSSKICGECMGRYPGRKERRGNRQGGP